MADHGAVLELASVRKSYAIGTPVEVEVLHGIDLQLDRGEFAALIGPSGSGKSTLLHIIGLLEPPTAGKLAIAGEAIEGLSDAEITQMRSVELGFIFQFHHLIPAFSALENVMMPLMLRAGRREHAMEERGRMLLESVGLTRWAQNKPGELSGGQQQRVAVARALAQSPALVLADEPTGNLDTATADEVFALLRRFNRESGTSFLIVTHDPRLAQRCDRIIELIDGRITSGG
jgi:lipoprotein-releasing system ATP-binding protein